MATCIEPLDETWKYRIPESLADLIPLFENRVACHRLWAEWLDQDTDETRRYAKHGIGPAKAHWDYVKQYSAAKSLIEEHLRAARPSPDKGEVTKAMVESLREARQFILAPAEDLLWGIVHRIDAAISAQQRAQEGMVLVPKEPTPEMLGAWYRYKNGHYFHGEEPPRDTSDVGAYRAMLAASAQGGA